MEHALLTISTLKGNRGRGFRLLLQFAFVLIHNNNTNYMNYCL